MEPLNHTDLILHPDGSIYHLNLFPEDIADTVILVGDPGRVGKISSLFDNIDVRKENREFVTHTGTYDGKRMSVLSTGIGTDNIDIVLNELDALVSIDLKTRMPRPHTRKLTLVRIGTSGALHADIAPGTFLMAEIAGGFDGLYHFYQDQQGITVPGLAQAFTGFTRWDQRLAEPYFVRASERLIRLFEGTDLQAGITLSTPGFYGPQLRSLRLVPKDSTLIQKLSAFSFGHLRIQNFEMESSALYALSAMLGHHALTFCVAIANRITSDFLEDYQPAINMLAKLVLDKLSLDEGSGT
ncbi:MAG: nucleoside phosphorylase [Bacteroidales bacterium]